MNILTEFRINKNDDIYTQTANIRKNFDKVVEEEAIINIVKCVSEKLDIPSSVISFEIKQFLITKFNFSEGYIDQSFHFKNIFKSIAKYICYFFWILFFSKKIKKVIKCDLIADDVTGKYQFNNLKNIIKEFKSYTIITESYFDKKYNQFKFKSLKGCSKDLVRKNFFFYTFHALLFAIKISIHKKINLVPIMQHILVRCVKYESLFDNIKAKYLIQTRQISTSIKNYYFKKSGGKIVASIQKSLHDFGSPGFYIDCDIFFSHGTKTMQFDDLTGSKIKKIIPVGSLALEQNWFLKKKIEVETNDIVNFAGNFNTRSSINFHANYINDYYDHLKWMIKISNKYPNLKILLKHHAGNENTDTKEIEILKNSRIKRITVDNSNNENYSYNHAFQANFSCTWNSIICYEMLGHGKPCFFLDPGGRNESFLQNDDFNTDWRIKSYNEFEEKVEKILIKGEKISIKNADYFCINSTDVSKKIAKYLLQKSF